MKKLYFKLQKFILTIILLFFYAYSLVNSYGWATSFEVTFLAWSFFLICMPLATGTVLIQTPLEFLFKKIRYPQILAWTIAIIGNFICYNNFPNLYFKASSTHVFYNVLSDLKTYWPIIAVSFTSTMYGCLIENIKKQNEPILKVFGILLRLSSITLTMWILYNDYILVLNSHGTP